MLKPFLGEALLVTATDRVEFENYLVGFGAGSKEAMEASLLRTHEYLQSKGISSDETDPAMPSDDTIEALISATSIGFERLVARLGLAKASQPFPEDLHRYIITEKLANFDIWNMRFLPTVDAWERVKTVEEVYAAFPSTGEGLTTEALMDRLDLDGVDPDIQHAFMVDLHVRRVITTIGKDV